ncbi:B12-binding domain-containing radical SAM protein, partial [Candidatus Omnitrophota bacterium]
MNNMNFKPKNITDILLIRPPEFTIFSESIELEKQTSGAVMLPLGILQLGSYVSSQFPDLGVWYLDLHIKCKLALKKQGSSLSLCDFILKDLKNSLDDMRPQIVGITCAFNAFADNLHHTAALVKKLNPEAIVIAGGNYVSVYTDRAFKDDNIDYIIIGEGEVPFTRFIKDYKNGRFPEGKIVNKKIFLDEFDSFPPLDYDAISLEEYFQFEMSSIYGNQGRTVNLFTSRGCPCRCIYCATHNVWDYGFRAQSAWNVFRQVTALKEKYGIQTFMFVEDNFVLDNNRVKDFCRLLIEHKTEVKWYPASARVNSLDEETLHLMAKAGCIRIGLAIESGTERVQKLIRKDVDLKHAKSMVECMRREKLMLEGLFVFGFPGETIDEIKETIRYASDLECDWYQLSIATPLYGTEMHEVCRKNNYLSDSGSFVELWNVGNIATPDFTQELVESIVRDANYRLNFIENVHYRNKRYDKVLPMFENVART